MTTVENRARGVGPRWPARPATYSASGRSWPDEYGWIRHAADAELDAYLAAEDEHCQAMLGPLAAETDRLMTSLLGFVAETEDSPPERHGAYEYLERTVAGSQYPRLSRRVRGGGAEELLIDLGALAEGSEYLDVGGVYFTHSQQRLAVLVDTSGEERYTVRVYDVAQCPITPASVPRDVLTDVGEVVWLDESSYCYVRFDEAWRACEVWRHRVGRHADADEMVYREEDPEFSVTIGLSASETYFEVLTASATTSETWLARATELSQAADVHELRAALACWMARRPEVLYSVEHFDPRHLAAGERVAGLDRACFVVLTNDGGQENFGLWATPDLEARDRADWQCLLAASDHRVLEGVAVFGRQLVVSIREQAELTLWLTRAQGGATPWRWMPVEIPSEGPGVLTLGTNADYDTEVLRCHRSGLACPDEAWDYDAERGEARFIQRYPAPGWQPDDFCAERLWVAHDGVEVPVTLLRRRELSLDGTAPALVVGYGAYDECYDATYDPTVMPLVADGWVYAIAHVRGGGELGEQWWRAGRGVAKENTFRDFDAVLRALVAQRYAAAGKIVVRGRSAGGLVAGNALHRSPELLACVVAEVPFVDALNTMCDPSLPLVIGERDEWGDPLADASSLEAIQRWAPYEQVRAQAYPPVLLTAGLHDPRVSFWEPIKLAARVRAASTSGEPVLVKLDRGAGHFGPSGRYDAWREEAEQLAFMQHCVTERARPDAGAEGHAEA